MRFIVLVAVVVIVIAAFVVEEVKKENNTGETPLVRLSLWIIDTSRFFFTPFSSTLQSIVHFPIQLIYEGF